MKILIIHDEDLTSGTRGMALENIELAAACMHLESGEFVYRSGSHIITSGPDHYAILGWADRIILVRDPYFLLLKDRNGLCDIRPLNELPLFLASTR